MKLAGFRLIAAPFTPMRADGSLNLEVVSDQAKHFVVTGVRGVFVGGTSGEGQSLTIDERLSLAEAWAADALRSELEFFVHVGHNSQREAMHLAEQAQSLGADAIAMHAPTWARQQELNDLIEFCAPIAAAASSLPFYLYDMPKITGVQISSAAFLATAKPRVPSLAGIKYTNPDCVTVQECIQSDGGQYDILWGCDEALLAALALGVSGAVGSTYNFAAPLYLRIVNAFEANDWGLARSEQARAVSMVRIFERFGTLAAIKFAMSLVGVDCGPVRAPLRNLSAADKRQLQANLEQIRFAQEIAAVDTIRDPRATFGESGPPGIDRFRLAPIRPAQ